MVNYFTRKLSKEGTVTYKPSVTFVEGFTNYIELQEQGEYIYRSIKQRKIQKNDLTLIDDVSYCKIIDCKLNDKSVANMTFVSIVRYVYEIINDAKKIEKHSVIETKAGLNTDDKFINIDNPQVYYSKKQHARTRIREILKQCSIHNIKFNMLIEKDSNYIVFDLQS
jgi:hypothetical protein